MTQKNAFSINEFCHSFGISRTHFYELSKKGLGPKVMMLGRRKLISVWAAKEWSEKISETVNESKQFTSNRDA